MSGECQFCYDHCLECKCGVKCIQPATPIGIGTQTLEFIPIPELPKEKVNHPSHYQGNKLEVIDVIEDFDLGFSLGNAVKYILRAGKKGDRIEDLRKAIWYIEREISNEQ